MYSYIHNICGNVVAGAERAVVPYFVCIYLYIYMLTCKPNESGSGVFF